MKFNPPPNWPPPPPGWTPPPGWRPDPSWPRPPAGWRLWVEEERTFVPAQPFGAQPFGAPPPPHRQQPRERWYLRTVSVVVFLLLCFPVGIVLAWLRTDWSLRRRGAITGVVAVVVVIVGATSSPPPTDTVQLSSPAGRAATLPATLPAAPAKTPSLTAAIPSSAPPTPSTASAAATTARQVSAVPTSSSAAPPPPMTAVTTRAAAPSAKPPTTRPPTTRPPTTEAPQPSTCGAPSNPYGYNFCGDGGYVTDPPGDICDYFDCIDNFWHGRGYMVECEDGTYSMSGGIRGACSDHDGEQRAVYSG